MDTISQKVDNYPTKYKEGFTRKETEELLKNYPDINMDKFNDVLMCITGLVLNNEFITYHCDIKTALRCGIEKRNIRSHEWD